MLESKLQRRFITWLLRSNVCCALQANGYGGYAAPAPANGHSNHYGSVPSARQNFSMSTEAYRAEHGLVVEGEGVPDPLQSFDSAGFSGPIMDEVQYFAQHSIHMLS